MTPRGMRALETLRAIAPKRAEYNEKRALEERDKGSSVSPKRGRKSIKWPFQFMEIGEIVTIDEDLEKGITIAAAIGGAHSYAAVSRKAFRCRTSLGNKSVTVERLKDPEIGPDGVLRRMKGPSKVRKSIKWPFNKMRVGETVTIEMKNNITPTKAIAAAHNQRDGRKFRCRTSIDGKSVSVYRIS